MHLPGILCTLSLLATVVLGQKGPDTTCKTDYTSKKPKTMVTKNTKTTITKTTTVGETQTLTVADTSTTTAYTTATATSTTTKIIREGPKYSTVTYFDQVVVTTTVTSTTTTTSPTTVYTDTTTITPTSTLPTPTTNWYPVISSLPKNNQGVYNGPPPGTNKRSIDPEVREEQTSPNAHVLQYRQTNETHDEVVVAERANAAKSFPATVACTTRTTSRSTKTTHTITFVTTPAPTRTITRSTTTTTTQTIIINAPTYRSTTIYFTSTQSQTATSTSTSTSQVFQQSTSYAPTYTYVPACDPSQGTVVDGVIGKKINAVGFHGSGITLPEVADPVECCILCMTTYQQNGNNCYSGWWSNTTTSKYGGAGCAITLSDSMYYHDQTALTIATGNTYYAIFNGIHGWWNEINFSK